MGKAKAPTVAPPPVGERREHIAHLMATNAYETFTTVRELAAKWGLSVHTIEKDTWEAARLLKLPPGQMDAARAQLAATFEAIARNALSTPSRITGLPDYGAALKAKELYARYAGLDAVLPAVHEEDSPERIEFTIADEPDEEDPAGEAAEGGDASPLAGLDDVPGVGTR